MALFKISKDKDFVFAIMDKIMEFRGDYELTEDSLAAAAAAASERVSDKDDDMEEEIIADNKNVDDDMEEAEIDLQTTNVSDQLHPTEEVMDDENASAEPTSHGEQPIDTDNTTSNDLATAEDTIDAEEDLDQNELLRFQLRTKVLGLSIPTFTTELWKYLQLAGWTYVSGSYHPPKEEKDDYTDPLIAAKRIFEQNDNKSATGSTEVNNSEEGPEVFHSANEIIDYLDQYCLPDYNLTSYQVKEERERLSKHSAAYERRCKRLRYELLEIAFRERLRENSHLVEKDGSMKSKYGHNHRPCEVCFQGASPMYPRVACRDCGLVVHTNCYGLSDYSGRNGSSSKNSQRVVDAKGLFQCEVCQVNLTQGSISKKQLLNAPQEARWRAHSHPTAICGLCDYPFIAGGMVHIKNESAQPGDKASSTKRRRSRESQSESWVHIFCYNAISERGYKQMIQNSSEVIEIIGKNSTNTHECCYCSKEDKGWTMACKKKCGNYFHPICLQFERACNGNISGKPNNICEKCSRSSDRDKSLKDDHQNAVLPKAAMFLTQNVKSNNMEAHVQYFKKPKKKKDAKEETLKKDIINVPLIRKSINDVRKVYTSEQCEAGFSTVESQYKTMFHEWSFSLSIGHSILLHGLGSKRGLLEAFGESLAVEGNVMSINGYDISADLTQFFDLMVQMVSQAETVPFNSLLDTSDENENESRKEWVKKASYIAENYSEDRPLFILIHNIDGENLSSSCAKEALATLTANSRRDNLTMISIVASIDDVNRSMFWNPLVEHKFNWSWKLVHTYRPHFEEFVKGPTEESIKRKTKKMRNKEKFNTSVKAVLESLSPKHREVVILLANMQSRDRIITYKQLKDACVKNMIAASDSVLRATLKELHDHNIVEHGMTGEGRSTMETVFIPQDEIMHEILAFAT